MSPTWTIILNIIVKIVETLLTHAQKNTTTTVDTQTNTKP